MQLTWRGWGRDPARKFDNSSTSITSSLQKYLGSGAALLCCLFYREYISVNRNSHYSLESRKVARDHCLHCRLLGSRQIAADTTFQKGTQKAMERKVFLFSPSVALQNLCFSNHLLSHLLLPPPVTYLHFPCLRFLFCTMKSVLG